MKKELINRHKKFFTWCLKLYNKCNIKNKMVLRKNKYKIGCSILKSTHIDVYHKNNKIIIADFCKLINCNIKIYGSNNVIKIEDNCYLKDVEFYIEDDFNEIIIGEHTSIYGKTHLAAIESTKIEIGKDCIFSNDIHFRTGDSHSIIDETEKRINKSKNIIIGNHVWIGTRVTCLKGTEIKDNSIVAAASLVCKKYIDSNVIIAGHPAKIIKDNINWKRERIRID
ncbi:acyltransferase [Megamonas hypermegale]|uniref:acyltransferase n=1 Tax=Megamonas hypermegale TaxID=158847 RepID=UPI001D1B1D03|nr:acyltransferase [Megamonas hypermegale]MBM6761405.1 acyltransferase [Megamonas hypermegale]